MTKVDLSKRSGVSRATFDNLRTGKRPPQPRVVHALAEAVGMDRGEAIRLAGLLPPVPDATISVHDAIVLSTYTEKQKDALLALVEAFDESNRSRNLGG